MAEFLAPSEQGHKPFCGWDDGKKDHVYARLAKIINDNKRIGIASAVPKEAYDRLPERIHQQYGRERYTFAVRMCMMRIMEWRDKSLISLPIRYVFDWQMNTDQKRKEISLILDIISKDKSLAPKFGLEVDGFSFEHKETFKPLQSADILAWQMRSHMRKIYPLGHDSEELCHQGFRQLRENQSMDLGFFTDAQFLDFDRWNQEKIDQLGPGGVLYPYA